MQLGVECEVCKVCGMLRLSAMQYEDELSALSDVDFLFWLKPSVGSDDALGEGLDIDGVVPAVGFEAVVAQQFLLCHQ
jgi:hypothetical protein